jgi:hypothetical protein
VLGSAHLDWQWYASVSGYAGGRVCGRETAVVLVVAEGGRYLEVGCTVELELVFVIHTSADHRLHLLNHVAEERNHLELRNTIALTTTKQANKPLEKEPAPVAVIFDVLGQQRRPVGVLFLHHRVDAHPRLNRGWHRAGTCSRRRVGSSAGACVGFLFTSCCRGGCVDRWLITASGVGVGFVLPIIGSVCLILPVVGCLILLRGLSLEDTAASVSE